VEKHLQYFSEKHAFNQSKQHIFRQKLKYHSQAISFPFSEEYPKTIQNSSGNIWKWKTENNMPCKPFCDKCHEGSCVLLTAGALPHPLEVSRNLWPQLVHSTFLQVSNAQSSASLAKKQRCSVTNKYFNVCLPKATNHQWRIQTRRLGGCQLGGIQKGLHLFKCQRLPTTIVKVSRESGCLL